jgi:hypothetical protein
LVLIRLNGNLLPPEVLENKSDSQINYKAYDATDAAQFYDLFIILLSPHRIELLASSKVSNVFETSSLFFASKYIGG